MIWQVRIRFVDVAAQSSEWDLQARPLLPRLQDLLSPQTAAFGEYQRRGGILGYSVVTRVPGSLEEVVV